MPKKTKELTPLEYGQRAYIAALMGQLKSAGWEPCEVASDSHRYVKNLTPNRVYALMVEHSRCAVFFRLADMVQWLELNEAAETPLRDWGTNIAAFDEIVTNFRLV